MGRRAPTAPRLRARVPTPGRGRGWLWPPIPRLRWTLGSPGDDRAKPTPPGRRAARRRRRRPPGAGTARRVRPGTRTSRGWPSRRGPWRAVRAATSALGRHRRRVARWPTTPPTGAHRDGEAAQGTGWSRAPRVGEGSGTQGRQQDSPVEAKPPRGRDEGGCQQRSKRVEGSSAAKGAFGIVRVRLDVDDVGGVGERAGAHPVDGERCQHRRIRRCQTHEERGQADAGRSEGEKHPSGPSVDEQRRRGLDDEGDPNSAPDPGAPPEAGRGRSDYERSGSARTRCPRAPRRRSGH